MFTSAACATFIRASSRGQAWPCSSARGGLPDTGPAGQFPFRHPQLGEFPGAGAFQQSEHDILQQFAGGPQADVVDAAERLPRPAAGSQRRGTGHAANAKNPSGRRRPGGATGFRSTSCSAAGIGAAPVPAMNLSDLTLTCCGGHDEPRPVR